MKRFLHTLGPGARIYCCDCRKSTGIVPAPDGEITKREIAYHEQIHTCGPSSEPWDARPAGKAS